MPTSKNYHSKAEEPRTAARQTEDRHERDMLLRLADQWDRLADHKAKKEAGQGGGTST